MWIRWEGKTGKKLRWRRDRGTGVGRRVKEEVEEVKKMEMWKSRREVKMK